MRNMSKQYDHKREHFHFPRTHARHSNIPFEQGPRKPTFREILNLIAIWSAVVIIFLIFWLDP